MQPAARAIRQCVKNTPNYSHTHKGITSTAISKSKSSSTKSTRLNHVQFLCQVGVTPFETEPKEAKLESKESEDAAEKEQRPGVEERKVNVSDNKNRQAGKRTYEEICRSYENMFAFDWELKDINNKSHPPGKFPTKYLCFILLYIVVYFWF